jgi:hypothetical protein
MYWVVSTRSSVDEDELLSTLGFALELELELALLLLLSADELSSSALDSLCDGLSKTESFSLDELCSIDSLWVL